jgi:hypothetical protein
MAARVRAAAECRRGGAGAIAACVQRAQQLQRAARAKTQKR